MVNTNIGIETKTFDKKYSDISLKKPIFLTKEEEVVEQFIQTLLLTRKYSIPFEDFGLDLEDYLFTMPSQINANIIFDTVVRGIQYYFSDIEIDFSKSGCELIEEKRLYYLKLFIILKSGKMITINEELGMKMEN